MPRVMYIGGSPCSGKSTIAERIADQYNMVYFKVDDYLDKYTDLGALRNEFICKKQKELSPEEIWMRDPELQCKEEFQFYEEIFHDVMKDIEKQSSETGIITEGAAFCPTLMRKTGIPEKDYVALIPESNFQITHYKEREWIPFVLSGCSDKEKAFSNWMQRDILFAQQVEHECTQQGYACIVNDGTKSVEDLLSEIATHFGL